MSNAPVDTGRRRFLTAATAVVGGAGAVAVAVPFIKSWNPSAKAKAAGAPVEVNISKVEPGQLIRVEWRGKPVWVVRRTEEILDGLAKHDNQLRDPASVEEQQPAYAQNAVRSINPEFFIAVGLCTHLGCSPTYRPEVAPADLGADWKGGFYCPCHGSRFDLAGRVLKGSPAGTNMVVPPYYYKTDSLVLIGEDGEAA